MNIFSPITTDLPDQSSIDEQFTPPHVRAERVWTELQKLDVTLFDLLWFSIYFLTHMIGALSDAPLSLLSALREITTHTASIHYSHWETFLSQEKEEQADNA